MNLSELINQKQQRADDWKAQKEREREDLNALSDKAILAITQEPEAYQRYLNLQAGNPGYSASNILLVMEQNPDATVIHDMENWNKLGRKIIKGSEGMRVRVADTYTKDGREYRGYKIGRVFDAAQTTGKATDAPISLQIDTPEMEAALRQLLELSPVRVNVGELDGDAYYDPGTQEITVSPNLTDHETFRALARELTHAQSHDNGRNSYYDRTENELDAESVSYMLCRSFGVPCDEPDASKIAELYADMETQDRRTILDGVQKYFRRLYGSIRKEIAPKEQEQTHSGRLSAATRGKNGGGTHR